MNSDETISKSSQISSITHATLMLRVLGAEYSLIICAPYSYHKGVRRPVYYVAGNDGNFRYDILLGYLAAHHREPGEFWSWVLCLETRQ